MICKIFCLLIFIAANATAQTADTMNVRLKSGTNIPYVFTSVNTLTFSGVQGKDTMKVNLKSGTVVQYSVASLDQVNFTNYQSTDSIFIELKKGTVKKYAIASLSKMTFIDWDKNTFVEPLEANGYFLGQNYPNPFNSSTTIQYYLPKPQNIKLTISTMTGRMMVNFIQQQQSSGMHQFNWDASAIPGGIYIYKLQAGEFTETKKMILLK
jgi:hypothetical protein